MEAPGRAGHEQCVRQRTGRAGALARIVPRRETDSCDFNNALIEHYTHAYATMKHHSDQALDLADASSIAVFSSYRDPAKPSRRLLVKPKEPGRATFELALSHGSVVTFSLDANRRFTHAIVLSANAPPNDWLGLTFRSSRTLVRFVEGHPCLPNGTRLTLAGDEQRREFFHLRRRENETSFTYPPLSYTISESDLWPLHRKPKRERDISHRPNPWAQRARRVDESHPIDGDAGHSQHAAHDVMGRAGQVVVGHIDLVIAEPPPQRGVLCLHRDAAGRHGEHVGERIQREVEPRHPRLLAVAGSEHTGAERRQEVTDVPRRGFAGGGDAADVLSEPRSTSASLACGPTAGRRRSTWASCRGAPASGWSHRSWVAPPRRRSGPPHTACAATPRGAPRGPRPPSSCPSRWRRGP